MNQSVRLPRPLAKSLLPFSLRSTLERAQDLLLRAPFLIVRPRTLLLILVALALLIGPVGQQADIIAAVFCYALLAVLALVLLITVGVGALLRQKLRIQLSIAADTSPVPHSGVAWGGRAYSLPLRIDGASIPPLWHLSLRLRVAPSPLALSEHLLTGRWLGRSIVEQITFPHRGVWKLESAEVRLSDQCALSADRWRIELGKEIVVEPAPVEFSAVPVISSCQRAGDTLPDQRIREGERFDLKRYHPSDGMGKIAWKIYARSGELLARHPEASMTPEGQTVVFCLADREHDLCCAQALAYLRKLEQLGLDVYFGFQGMRGTPAVRSAAQAKQHLIDSAWDAHSSREQIAKEIDTLVTSLEGDSGSTLTRIVVFLQSARVSTLEGQNDVLWLLEQLARKKIDPLVVVAEEHPQANRRSADQRSGTILGARLKRWLGAAFVREAQFQSAKIDPSSTESVQKFVSKCGAQHWEVVRV
jgi:uncharacterized protein (DUF58 family)